MELKETKGYKKLSGVTRDDLCMFLQMQYDHLTRHSSHEEVLQVFINNVEGDYSQLPDALSEIAIEQDKELGVYEG